MRSAFIGIAALALASCSNQPDHFICDGARWPVDETPIDVSNMSATLELIPTLNRWIFRTPHYGYLKVDSNRYLFYVSSVRPEKIYFRHGPEDAPSGGGQFDLINGEMSFSVDDSIYRLDCHRATPLADA
jgi:hypothetical protein